MGVSGNDMMKKATRRAFMKGTGGAGTLFAMGGMAPHFLVGTAEAVSKGKAAEEKGKGDHVLVVVQLSGGNDGLNTVVPVGDDVYHKNRFITRIRKESAIKIDDYHGFHPSLDGFGKLLDDGRLAVLQGVGYPNPNRSHFVSMDIWHSARPGASRRTTGWLGRYVDGTSGRRGKRNDVAGIHLGDSRQPLALAGTKVQTPSIQSLEGFKLHTSGDGKLKKAMETGAKVNRAGGSDLLTFMQRSTASAMGSSERIQEALKDYEPAVKYPNSRLGDQLKTVAQLIEAGMTTRIYYLTHGGFDTHANQAQTHAALLKQLGDAVSAFCFDMKKRGHDKRVALMSFSEFGRRVKENASRGTDHGAAAPLFMAGGAVKKGLIGKHPSMTDLDQGDLKFHTDFRKVYATVLDEWLGYDSRKVLGGGFGKVKVFA